MAFLLLLSFLFMLFASPALLVPELDAVRPAQLAGIGAMALLVVRKTLWRSPWRFPWPDAYLVPWLLAGAALSISGALWPRLAAETALDMLKIGIVYYLIVNCIDSELRLRRATGVLVLGGMFPAVGALLNYLTGNVVDGRAGWVGSYANPNDLAYTLVILIPFVWQMIPGAPLWLKPVLLGMLGTFFAAIFVTRSRGGMIGAVAVLTILGLRQRGIGGKAATAAFLILLLLGASLYWTRDVGFQNLRSDVTVNQRVETIKAGLQMFMDNPIAGVGVGNSALAWPLYAPPDLPVTHALVIHNTLVQSLAELGLFGFVPLFLLVALAWKRARHMIRATEYKSYGWSVSVALEASLIGYIVCGLSGGYLTSWFPYIVIGLISAVAMISREEAQREESPLPELQLEGVRRMDARIV